MKYNDTDVNVNKGYYMININKINLSEKEKNILSILNAIINTNEILSSDISAITGLSISTISRVLALLKQKDIVVQTGKEKTDKGRRPEYVQFNKNYGMLVHLDIMPDGIIGCIANLNGEVSNTEIINFEDKVLTLNLLLDSIQTIYASIVRKYLYKGQKVLAVGISLPGVVDEDKRLVYRIPDIFPFNDIDVFDYAERMLNVPVIVSNVSALAARGEQIRCYPECEDLVYLNILPTIGIGAGVIINGKLVKGKQFMAGEVGDIYFDRNNFSKDSKLSVGRLEEYAGLKALYNKITQKMKTGGADILKEIMTEEKAVKVDLGLIERAVQAGDMDVEEIFRDVLQVWVILLMNIILLINPEHLIIGGAITPKNIKTIDTINEMLEKALFRDLKVRVSEVGENAVLTGGLHILRLYVLNNIIAKEAIRNL